MASSVGILAYGSLIGDPGSEIGSKIVEVIDCRTPFKVEFARKSRSRSNAPTLVQFDKGGCVCGKVLVVDLDLQEAYDCLYRREINCVGCESKTYDHDNKKKDAVKIGELPEFKGIDSVMYADLPANIEDLTADKLANLAIESAKKRCDGRDGISYLINAKCTGIITPLSGEYETKILKLTDTTSLCDAREVCRSKQGCPKKC